MAKTSERLSALKVKNLKGLGYFSDGGNLYFRIAPGDARGWIFRFAMHGRTRDMGLGAYPEISLADARELAAKCRVLLKQGIRPHRSAARSAREPARRSGQDPDVRRMRARLHSRP
jgi:Arm DNA-binding domain